MMPLSHALRIFGIAALVIAHPQQTPQEAHDAAAAAIYARADALLGQNSSPSTAIAFGVTLPQTCTTGALFFLTTPATLYGCSAGTWTSFGQGAGQNLTVKTDGVVVGTRPVQNFQAGAGIVSVMSDSGSEINIEIAVDTAIVETQQRAQSGQELLCASEGGSASAYSCRMSPTSGPYAVGMVLHWIPDVSGAGGATTLDVDTLGAVPVKQSDGSSDPTSSDIVGGRLSQIWYDGGAFRLQ
jgi:hypothetical protein